MATIEEIKELREETGCSVTKCKEALEESGGDKSKAIEFLKKKGAEVAEKKIDRETPNGRVEAYIHSNNKVGVLLDIRCESDFVAKSDEFKQLAHDIALHIAGMSPKYISPDDIPEEYLAGEREIYKEQFADSGKPEEIVNNIVGGKLNKFKEQHSLFTQPFVKNQDKTVQDVIRDYVGKIGENITVMNFVRYEI